MRIALFLLFSLTSLVFAQNQKTFSIMTYNAENLFDAKHDADREDFPNLPIALKKGLYKKETEQACLHRGPVGSNGFFECINMDWNEQVFDAKATQIGKVVGMYNNGKGADIVVMQEIENQNVMNKLLEKTKAIGFKYALLMEDHDMRGIDVGILSKYPIVSSEMHSAEPNLGIKRGIYQYNININGSKVTVLGNHWPSQNNPVDDRMNASELLQSVAKSISNADMVVSVGDFNTPDEEVPNAIHTIYNEHLDVKPEAEKLGVPLFPGTYKFKGKWGTLDRFLIRKSDLNRGKVKPIITSFEIVSNPELLKGVNGTAPGNLPSGFQSGRFQNGGFQNGNTNHGRSITALDEIGDPSKAPVRFNPKNGQGYSDHLPVAMKFELAR